MTVIIDVAHALQGLRNAVELKGEDFIYDSEEFQKLRGPDCLYAVIEDGKAVPSCIVGHVLAAAGVPVKEMVWAFTPGDAGMFSSDVIWDLYLKINRDCEGVEITRDAASVLQAAQSCQDTGNTWGAALDAAELKAATL